MVGVCLWFVVPCLVVCRLMCVVCRILIGARRLLFVACCVLFVGCCLLRVARCAVFVACLLWFGVVRCVIVVLGFACCS